MSIILSAKNISKSYSLNNKIKIDVLKNISLDVNNSEYLALIGPSGAGKSTLLYILAAIENYDNGNIVYNIDNKNISLNLKDDQQVSQFRNQNIGFIFQFHHLLPEFTVLENIAMPSLIKGISYDEAISYANKLIDLVGIKDRANHKPAEISGGEQQRAAIARALINKPALIFADEPTGNLDENNSNIILNLINDIRKEYNTTFVIATHSDKIAQAADRIIRLKDGNISQ